MTDLTDRLAALPPTQRVDTYKVLVTDVVATASVAAHPDGQYVKRSDYEALAARNALLCEALREHACGEAWCQYDFDASCTCDLRAILAACEVRK